eukprot:2434057-Prymnesium_polylepis.2
MAAVSVEVLLAVAAVVAVKTVEAVQVQAALGEGMARVVVAAEEVTTAVGAKAAAVDAMAQ